MRKNLVMLIATLGLTLLYGCTTKDFYGLKLTDNWQAKDVSSAELMAFLGQDRTNEHEIAEYNAPPNRTLEELVNSGYMCGNFAVDLHNNAEKFGIKCAIVECPEKGHAFNVFDTTDKGLVYVDASTGIDSFAYYQEPDLLIADSKIREGIGDSAIRYLGNPETFKIKW